MTLKIEDIKAFLSGRKIEFYQDREIKSFLTLRIGARVRFIIVIRESRDLHALLRLFHQGRQRYILLGGGSNVIFPDCNSDLIVIINRTSAISKLGGEKIKVNSGITNANLLSWNSEHNVGGMEFLAGIPGTIGGAAAVNAGAFGKSISEILEKADIFSEKGESKTVDRAYFNYGYRESVFKYGNEVILNVYLRFEKADNRAIREKTRGNIRYRKDNHPSYKENTAGCFFKNPVNKGQKISAGKLIENSGLKGAEYGDLIISPAHANFLINRGSASFSDIQAFSEQVCQKVLQDSGIQLEREVIYISPQGQKY